MHSCPFQQRSLKIKWVKSTFRNYVAEKGKHGTCQPPQQKDSLLKEDYFDCSSSSAARKTNEQIFSELLEAA